MSTVAVEERSGRMIARLAGEIDLQDVDRVSGQVLSAVPNSARGVVLDLSDVTYLDSAAIQMLFDIVRRMNTARQEVAIAVPESSPLATLLKITHVHEACPVAPTVDECLEALTRDAKLY